jgi:hypothetical protein
LKTASDAGRDAVTPPVITITGINDQLPPEPVITFRRIRRSRSTGIRDHHRPERATLS